MRSEIIEIGIVEADTSSSEITRERSFLVRPAVSEISPFCTDLTGITPAAVRREGRPLDEILRTIGNEYGLAKTVVTWGNDAGGIDRCCKEAGITNPFEATRFINVGQLLSLMIGEDRRVGLYEALHMLGVDETGRRHSGLDDARNTMLAYLEIGHRTVLRSSAAKTPQEICATKAA
jgi:inhibitor of KinA sporulation pathway (predicted exonuclease)